MTRIGIDFGGVIVRNRKLVRDEDTGLAGSDKAAVAQDGVFDAIHEIISKAGPRMQARTRAWLDTVDFFSRTGLDAATYGSASNGKRRRQSAANLRSATSSMITYTSCKSFDTQCRISTSSLRKAASGSVHLGRPPCPTGPKWWNC